MILKSLKLENIRSYLYEEIKFPESSVLLAGDIGSGKSTILLAIEFALFGLKPDLTGESLLRHGKNEGSVEIKFSIENNTVIVKRTLKRMKEAVRQNSGYIIFNQTKKEATATELKSKIISLLGYPEALVSKSKDLIYRFTVYTPQEEMKQILYENKDIRLDTLRKVFGVDKYKKIRENAQNYLRDLKIKRKEYEGFISDLDEKKSQKNEKIEWLDKTKASIKKLEPELEEINKKIDNKKKYLSEYERIIKELNSLRNNLEIYESKITDIDEQKISMKKEIQEIDANITKLKQEIDEKEISQFENLINEIKVKDKEIEDKETKLEEIKGKLREFSVIKNNSVNLKEKIFRLEVCPLCRQNVTKDHIDNICKEETKKIKDIEEKFFFCEKQESAIKIAITKSKSELSKLMEKEKKLEINKIKLRNLNEKIDRKSKVESQTKELNKKQELIKTKIKELKERLAKYPDIDKKYEDKKEALDEILQDRRDIELRLTALKKENEMLENEIKRIGLEIKKKLEIKNKINYLAQLQGWVENFFTKIMYSMEKQVMAKVHTEFNELVKEWFNMLIEDEVLNIRLDEEFTPVIEQNGYETYMGNLSGGEKTAVALAYRLALNKVVNDLISEIKTKDIIILDEPTDGFSSDQLDRVKDIIDSLNIKQVIIVSHEQKIETFVENVIRISKREHVSSIV